MFLKTAEKETLKYGNDGIYLGQLVTKYQTTKQHGLLTEISGIMYPIIERYITNHCSDRSEQDRQDLTQEAMLLLIDKAITQYDMSKNNNFVGYFTHSWMQKAIEKINGETQKVKIPDKKNRAINKIKKAEHDLRRDGYEATIKNISEMTGIEENIVRELQKIMISTNVAPIEKKTDDDEIEDLLNTHLVSDPLFKNLEREAIFNKLRTWGHNTGVPKQNIESIITWAGGGYSYRDIANEYGMQDEIEATKIIKGTISCIKKDPLFREDFYHELNGEKEHNPLYKKRTRRPKGTLVDSCPEEAKYLKEYGVYITFEGEVYVNDVYEEDKYVLLNKALCNGYYTVRPESGEPAIYVHRLYAEAFLERLPGQDVVQFCTPDRKNFRAIRWATASETCKRAQKKSSKYKKPDKEQE